LTIGIKGSLDIAGPKRRPRTDLHQRRRLFSFLPQGVSAVAAAPRQGWA